MAPSRLFKAFTSEGGIKSPLLVIDWHPVKKGAFEQKLKPGEIVPVNIALYPSSAFFSAGESLQLIIASDEIIPSPPYKKDASLSNSSGCNGVRRSSRLIDLKRCWKA